MASWQTNTQFYGETNGFAMEGYYNSYDLNLAPTNEEPLSISFVWWSPPFWSQTPWWEDYDLVPEGTPSQAPLNDLSFIKISLDGDPDEFSYLVFRDLEDLDDDIFIDFDGTDIELSVDNRNDIELDELFAEILQDPSWFNGIESPEFDIVKFLEVPSVEPILPLPVNPPGPGTDIPEGSSVVGVFAIGLTLVGMAIKRSFFQKA